jgi:hypothetical protein
MLDPHKPRRTRLSPFLFLAFLAFGSPSAFSAGHSAEGATGDPPSACADASPERNAYFGDLHVHTAMSADAIGFDVRMRPDDAYRYAFGGSLMLPPLDADGRPTRVHTNPRPLDFMASTDHAETLGEVSVCHDPQSMGYDSELCEVMRSDAAYPVDLLLLIGSPFAAHDEETCGDELERCRERADSYWKETRDSAERWNRACEHTAFIGYEYSSFRLGSNLHRNVIFRGSEVIDTPISHIDAPNDYELWERLASECLDAGTGCDVLAIPHNMNISNGRMFSLNYPGAWTREAKADMARLRMRVEPIVEIMQHKGDSECRNGLPGVQGGVDELCDFEKMVDHILRDENGEIETPTCYEGWGAHWLPRLGPSCFSRQNYVRTALIEGLRQEEEIGVNPFKFGISASTDTHNAIGGGVEESVFPGHLGKQDADPIARLAADTGRAGGMSTNPGGLIGIWAEENTRSSLFDAMKRREVFGTSGPRIKVRFHGGWRYADDLCERPERLAIADEGGVSMGSDLPPRAEADSPRFLVLAQADPGTTSIPGVPLDRVQVIKGWVGEDGDSHQRVFDVAGRSGSGATVDLDTCEPIGDGHRDLCAVWEDPEFDAARRAVYYVRAVENPTCRYSQHDCIRLAPEDRPDSCRHENESPVIQERAWSSPIWYTPESTSTSK